MRTLGLLTKVYITLTICSLLACCVVVEKDIQHVIPINVNKTSIVTKTSSGEVTLHNNFINNKPICNNNNLFCN